jgi:hypothetical protein
MAFWKCVKYATYHPPKTHNLSLPTNCNHRKEKVIQVFINICLLHVILQCHMWLMLIKAAHTCVLQLLWENWWTLHIMTKRDFQLMHKCKKCIMFWMCSSSVTFFTKHWPHQIDTIFVLHSRRTQNTYLV